MPGHIGKSMPGHISDVSSIQKFDVRLQWRLCFWTRKNIGFWHFGYLTFRHSDFQFPSSRFSFVHLSTFWKSEKIWEKCGFGVWEVWRAIFIVNFEKRVAQKLRRIILLHFGLVTFRIHFGRTRKPLVFVILDLVDMSMAPKTNYLKLWRHQITPNNPRKSRIISNRFFWKSQNIGNPNNWNYWNISGPKNPEDLFIKFLKILDMISISIKKMKCQFGNMGSISIQKHEMEIW